MGPAVGEVCTGRSAGVCSWVHTCAQNCTRLHPIVQTSTSRGAKLCTAHVPRWPVTSVLRMPEVRASVLRAVRSPALNSPILCTPGPRHSGCAHPPVFATPTVRSR